MAVTSESDDRRVNAVSAATRSDMGMVIARNPGHDVQEELARIRQRGSLGQHELHEAEHLLKEEGEREDGDAQEEGRRGAPA